MELRRSKVWVIVALFIALLGVACFFGFRAVNKTETVNNFGLQPASDGTLTLNGQLKLSDTLVLTPGTAPGAPVAGQIYYDRVTNVLNYYNGTKFVALKGGVTSLTSSNGGLIISDDGEGNLSISLGDVGTSSTTSSGGSGGTAGVASGGTGKTSLAKNGVLVGNGTASIGSVVAGSAGLCLLSTTGSPEFSTCPVGGSGDAFVQGGNGFGAVAVLGTVDNFGLSVRTNSSEVAAFSSSGAVTFQNTSNSTAGFRILNASGVAQAVFDTTNSRLYVGNPTGDNTGALLVLDAKASGGDPAGMAGAMYYNSNLGQFRCFEVDYWRDCVESIHTAYRYFNDLIGNASDSSADLISSGGAYGSQNSEAGHVGIQELATTSGGTGTYVWIVPRSSAAEVALLGNGDVWRHESSVRIRTSTGGLSTGGERYSFRTGFLDNAIDNSGNGTNGCYFRYSDNINSGKWQGTCRNNGVESVCDAVVTVAVDTWYRLSVVANAAGDSVDFRINGTSRCQVVSNIPNTTGRETNWGTALYKDIGTTNRSVDVDYFEVTAQFGTAR